MGTTEKVPYHFNVHYFLSLITYRLPILIIHLLNNLQVTYTSCHDTNICDKDNSENAFPQNTDGNIHQTANDRTKVLKEVWIESDVLGLRSAIKKFGLDRYKRNYLAASEGFEFVLQSHKGSSGTEKGLVTNSKANDSTVTSSTGVSHGLNVDSTIKLKQYTRAYS